MQLGGFADSQPEATGNEPTRAPRSSHLGPIVWVRSRTHPCQFGPGVAAAEVSTSLIVSHTRRRRQREEGLKRGGPAETRRDANNIGPPLPGEAAASRRQGGRGRAALKLPVSFKGSRGDKGLERERRTRAAVRPKWPGVLRYHARHWRIKPGHESRACGTGPAAAE